MISLQQSEIDQLRFETAIMEKETSKLRGIFQKRGTAPVTQEERRAVRRANDEVAEIFPDRHCVSGDKVAQEMNKDHERIKFPRRGELRRPAFGQFKSAGLIQQYNMPKAL